MMVALIFWLQMKYKDKMIAARTIQRATVDTILWKICDVLYLKAFVDIDRHRDSKKAT